MENNMPKEKEKNDEVPNAPASGDQGARAPEAMSHADIFEESKRFWEGPGHVGFEGAPPPPRPLSSRVYAAPPSNLPPGGISLGELKEQASRRDDGGAPVPTKLPPPAF